MLAMLTGNGRRSVVTMSTRRINKASECFKVHLLRLFITIRRPAIRNRYGQLLSKKVNAVWLQK